MNPPKWLSERIVLAIHDQQIAEHVGRTGLRDPVMLNLAAAYGFGLAKNHPFIDGNKRVAFMAMYVFLKINGFELDAPEAEATIFMMRLACGEESQETLAQWLKSFTKAV
jgi:death on curing protein